MLLRITTWTLQSASGASALYTACRCNKLLTAPSDELARNRDSHLLLDLHLAFPALILLSNLGLLLL
jgi:hypothetical protein